MKVIAHIGNFRFGGIVINVIRVTTYDKKELVTYQVCTLWGSVIDVPEADCKIQH